MRRSIVFALCVTVLCILLVVTLLYPANQPKTLQNAVTKAIDYLKESTDPYALLWLDMIHRRFGIEEFSATLQRYDQLIAENPQNASMLRVFRRIADHNNQVQEGDFQALHFNVDFITAPALYCDRFGLPDDYPALLENAANRGGYMLTHVLLALIWIQENGYEMPVSNDFVDDVNRDTAALIGDDPVMGDLKLEAAAFLYLAGQGKLVNETFIERVIAAQHDDGGWAKYINRPDESDWHPTILGLLILLHVKHPADLYPPMLNPASP